MEFALQVSGDYETLLDAARFAEDYGLVAFALPDHYLMALDEEEAKTAPANDAFAQLGGLARDTQGVELVVLVSPITFRHPAVLAKMAITLDNMSGGRFTLGIGTGWMDREHEVFGIDYPEMSQRFEMMEEALAYVRAAADPASPGYAGLRYRLEPFPISPPPARPLRLLVGGTGMHKTPRLAGAFADEFNAYPGPDLAGRLDRARAAATEAGRDGNAILMSTSGQVVGADDEAELEDKLNTWAEEAGMSRERLDELLARRNSPVGTWEQIAERFEEWSAAGITRFYLQSRWDPEETPAMIDRLGGGDPYSSGP